MSMTVGQLKAALALLGDRFDNDELKVWLPGSTITVGPRIFKSDKHNAMLIEGNVDPGSALSGE